MSNLGLIAEPLGKVARAFEMLNVRYYVGGSVASSYHGAPRSTLDVDLVAELNRDQVPALVRSLGSEFYASETTILDAVDRKTSFNLIYLPTSFKIDIFVSLDREFERSVFRRALSSNLAGKSGVSAPVASPEDVIISKLEWYRLGNEVSERQWSDVKSVLSVLGESADREYLRKAARQVGVSDLVERLLADSD